MKNIKSIFAFTILLGGLSSCTLTVPHAVTEHPIGDKKGISKSTVLFGSIYLNGDYSVAEAAKNGKIKGPISTVDIKTTSYFIFSVKELIVTGDEN